jgi:cell wall-associated NlpC family hydrolase
VSAAQAELERYQAEASAAEQTYHETHDRLLAAQQQAAQTAADIADQEGRVAALQDQVVQIALQQYQNRGMSEASTLLMSESSEQLLYEMSATSRMTESTQATIQNYQLERSELLARQAQLEAATAQIAADDARLNELRQAAEDKAGQAQTLLSNLKAAEAREAALQARVRNATNPTTQTTAVSQQAPAYSGDGSAASQVVAFALSKVGGPYVYGGNGPVGYDCSGLTRAAYLQVGISLPRTSGGQYGVGRPVSTSALLPGDLLFYYSGISHVAIYIGNGQIAHASTYGVGIVVSDAFSMSLAGARRLL